MRPIWGSVFVPSRSLSREALNTSRQTGITFGSNVGAALRHQANELTRLKKAVGATMDTTENVIDPDFSVATPQEMEVVARDMPIILQGPAAYAQHLMREAGCNQEQEDVIALIVAPLEHRFRSQYGNRQMQRRC